MAFLLPMAEASSAAVTVAAAAAAATGKRRIGSIVTSVCALKVKDGEARVIRVSDPLRDAEKTIYPLLSGPELRDSHPPTSPASTPLSSAPSRQKGGGGEEDKQKYYVNLGYAIRTLREDYPVLFYREPSFDIYREDIVFKDPFNTFAGIQNYKRIFWALRFCGKIFFKALWLDVVSIWQPFENIIMIRWTIHGVPRVPWESQGRFDGTSEYKLDKEGKIYEHRVDNVAMNSPPKFRIPPIEELIMAMGCPSPPRPSLFQSMHYPVVSYLPLLVRFTWVRFYIALQITLAWRCVAEGG